MSFSWSSLLIKTGVLNGSKTDPKPTTSEEFLFSSNLTIMFLSQSNASRS